jgi:hypothetical protein
MKKFGTVYFPCDVASLNKRVTEQVAHQTTEGILSWELVNDIDRYVFYICC